MSSDHGYEHETTEVSPAGDADQREDAKGALIVITCLVAIIAHYVSGWSF